MGLLRFCWCWLAAAPCLLHCSLLLTSVRSSQPDVDLFFLLYIFTLHPNLKTVTDLELLKGVYSDGQSVAKGSVAINHGYGLCQPNKILRSVAWLLGDGGLDGLIRGRCALLLLVDGIGLQRRRHGGHLGHGRDWSDSWRVGNGSATVDRRGDGSRGGRAGVVEKAGAGRGRALAAALG
ncbi:unnamed protein product [Miscanthus lutarioriparius]|uniref:Uncharacterized protein n=1 Tax=Miscanthus lutarioriparius TaxID=422564 RepID=A0A811R9Z9_9POAL|nr:unnamed protein product [Miscanthus lutarioriparius]